ncbi:helix-turn-helix transcriptional regulator [Minwuia sp.]|uniref:helix-turn-helix transcriptional regulator n=1 Tax=Minwuia sp. TaxID=2493630 RepID=UPI003A8DB413
MFNELSLDLRVARRQAGLTQTDCAHLLGLSKQLVSRIEKAERRPTPEEAAILCVLYNRSFESLFAAVLSDAVRLLDARLGTLPPPPSHWIATYNRQLTLSSLAERLADDNARDHGS